MKPANDSDISAFSEVFCKTLNVMYKSNNKEFYLYKVIISNTFFILHFEYSKPGSPPIVEHEDLDNYINKVIPQNKESKEGYRIKKIFKTYGNDRFIVVKPKTKKYWLRSIALRDADETIDEYIKARHSND
jgi:hypothetical protein